MESAGRERAPVRAGGDAGDALAGSLRDIALAGSQSQRCPGQSPAIPAAPATLKVSESVDSEPDATMARTWSCHGREVCLYDTAGVTGHGDGGPLAKAA